MKDNGRITKGVGTIRLQRQVTSVNAKAKLLSAFLFTLQQRRIQVFHPLLSPPEFVWVCR